MTTARFADRVVLVTGAASGIGAAAACRLADEGARLVVTDRDADGLARLETSCSDALSIAADTADAAAIDGVVGDAVDRFGRIDVLVANAGIWQERPFLELTADEWDRIMHVNLRGTFLMCQRVARAMVAGGRPGAIVVTASTNSTVAEIDTAHYTASKGGVLMLTKSMAVDLAPYDIRVNAVAPGTTKTPLNQAALDRMSETAVAASLPPIRRWAHADELAGTIAFLASDDAAYVTGTSVLVDGGRLALNGPAKELP